MTVAEVDRRTLPATLLVHREALRRAGPLAWGRALFPHLLYGALSPLHEALNEWHRQEATRPPGAMDAFAAPRGHGKTTGGVEVPAMYHAAYCSRRFIVIASDTYSQAIQRVATISVEVETNGALRALHPRLVPARDAFGRLVAWRDDELAFACGCRIVGVGAGKSIRGAKFRERRPDLLLLDDLEDDESVATEKAREKRLRWITRTALALAGPKRKISALWVGTILSRSALLNLATGAALEEGQTRPDWSRPWTPHVYRAEVEGSPKRRTVVVDEGEIVHGNDGKPLVFDVGAPLWSELTRADLALVRYRIGPLSYAAEYLSDPAESASTLLAPPMRARYVNPDAVPLARVVQLPDGTLVPVAAMTRAVALDPQYAQKTDSNDPDLAAVVVAGQYGAMSFLLDVWIGRDRHGQAARLVDLGIRWSCYAGGVEAVAAQAVTADAAADMAVLPIVALPPIGDKIDRALGLAVRLGDRHKPETCRVFLLPDADREFPEGKLYDFLVRFPHGRYKDPVDATVYAVELAARASVGTGGAGPQLGSSR